MEQCSFYLVKSWTLDDLPNDHHDILERYMNKDWTLYNIAFVLKDILLGTLNLTILFVDHV